MGCRSAFCARSDRDSNSGAGFADYTLSRRVPLQYISLYYRHLYYKGFAFAGDLRKSCNFNTFVDLAKPCSVTSYLQCKVTRF